MGVQGLWQLLAPVGQPVTLESLENKILAVDISIWLNQALKGFRDSQGGSVPNAHLLSLFSRICKLLFYKIRPIIVFDGGVPELKKQTVASRQIRRDLIKQNCRQAGLKILANYMASKALDVSKDKKSKNKNSPKSKDDDIYHLPPLPTSDSDNDNIQDDYDEMEYRHNHITTEEMKYLCSIDFESEDFEALPLDIKQEILATLKENRKHKSWEYYEALPDDSQDFASYQMQCLLKRRRLQGKLEEIQKEMRQTTSAHILALYNDEEHIFGEPSKIMSDDQSHYVLIKKIVQGIKRKSGTSDSNSAKEAKISNNGLPNKQKLFTKVTENSLSGKQDVRLEEPLEILHESNNVIFKEVGKKSSDILKSISKNKVLNTSYTEKVKDLVESIPCGTEKRFDKKAVECKNSKKYENNDFSGESNLNEYKIENDSLLSICDEVISPEKVSAEGSIECKDSSEIGLKDFSKKWEDVEIVQLKDNNDCLDNVSKSVKCFQPSNNKNDSAHQQADNFDSFKLNTNSVISQNNTERSKVATLNNRNNLSEDSDKTENECEASACTTGNKITVKNSFEEKAFPNSKNLISSSDIFWATNEMQTSECCLNSDTSEKQMVKSLSTVNENTVLSNYKPSSDISMPSCSSLDELATVSEDEVIAYDENILETNAAIQNELMMASAVLEAEQVKQQRQASTIQEHTYQECQELLRLFGVPYIISPLEAEAQCAFFDSENVTHGTITDDSDVWLFGGHKVYKNFFSHGKYVEFYRDTEIFSHFGLNRKKLIDFAMLTGSDYTQGIEGVGPVTAMEIMSEFSGEGIEVLYNFKEWWNSANKQPVPPKNKIRAKLQRLTINDGFPSSKVYDAYLNPKVDNSTESFTWGRPDLDTLRDYTREKFGWNKNKADDALLPVMKRLNERTTQTHLDSFFTIHLKKEKNLFPSKRIMSALKKINSPGKKVSVEDGSEEVEEKRKKAHSSTKTANKKIQRKKVVQRKEKISKKKQPISKKKEIRTLQLSEESSSDN